VGKASGKRLSTSPWNVGPWLPLGQAITPMQAVGGGVVLIGLALARQGDRSEKVDAATWPDAGAVEGLTPCAKPES